MEPMDEVVGWVAKRRELSWGGGRVIFGAGIVDEQIGEPLRWSKNGFLGINRVFEGKFSSLVYEQRLSSCKTTFFHTMNYLAKMISGNIRLWIGHYFLKNFQRNISGASSIKRCLKLAIHNLWHVIVTVYYSYWNLKYNKASE